jgi:hypothetical protein
MELAIGSRNWIFNYLKTRIMKNLPTIDMLNYVKTHNKKDSLLYNNRLFFGYVNPSDKRKAEYSANRLFILKHFEDALIESHEEDRSGNKWQVAVNFI